ncbi:MAG: 4'-phosphopantetheinyl transferase superfamily protein [Flavobacteriaceae bacterium]|jgi:4'-phosphopantetheinyl transferase EntD|nr:4'-phosphopantetheinyl transferase superfamily protein [Flavobacteriaceae bacterium]
MSVYKDFSVGNSKILLWKYEEGEHFDAKQLLEPENYERLKAFHPKKLLETLMVRKILKDILPEHKILYKDGEPYLQPKDFEISITNSFPLAALAISDEKIGIDLELFNPKILRVRDKFIVPEERIFIPENRETEYLTVIWSIKESLYKIHHSKYWSLKAHYEVKPFDLDNLSTIECRVHDEYFSDTFSAKVYLFEEFCFSVVV